MEEEINEKALIREMYKYYKRMNETMDKMEPMIKFIDSPEFKEFAESFGTIFTEAIDELAS